VHATGNLQVAADGARAQINATGRNASRIPAARLADHNFRMINAYHLAPFGEFRCPFNGNTWTEANLKMRSSG